MAGLNTASLTQSVAWKIRKTNTAPLSDVIQQGSFAHRPTIDVASTTDALVAVYSIAGGTKQVETATAAGTITGSGNADVVVTAAGMTGSPKTINVAVVNGDTAATWAGKVRVALAADADVIDFFTVSGSTTAIVLTAKDAAANDATLNISLDNGTCTGITTAASSANTTAGVAGGTQDVDLTSFTDLAGNVITSITKVQYLMLKATGNGAKVRLKPKTANGCRWMFGAMAHHVQLACGTVGCCMQFSDGVVGAVTADNSKFTLSNPGNATATVSLFVGVGA